MNLAVLIPTFRRNAGLERALNSVFAQELHPDEIIISDNSPEAGARDLVDAMRLGAPCPLVYVHASVPGVANARNAGFAATKAQRIAQLDDDESAAPDWLASLVAMSDQTGAAVVFGPVRAARGESTADAVAMAWADRLYARTPVLDDGLIDAPWGCGNSLIDRSACALPDPVFDLQTNDIGGEDDLLFADIARRGGRLAWAGDALVYEHVDPARLTRAALFRRSFAFGQGPSQTAADQKRWHGVAMWMAVGALQAAAFGPAACLMDAAGLGPSRLRAQLLDRASQGVGKLAWLNRFAPRLYGAALAKADQP